MPGERAGAGAKGRSPAAADAIRPAAAGGVHRLLGMAPPPGVRVRFAGQMPPIGFRYGPRGAAGAGHLTPPLPGFASSAWDAAAERGDGSVHDAPARSATRGEPRAQADAWDDWTAEEMQSAPPAHRPGQARTVAPAMIDPPTPATTDASLIPPASATTDPSMVPLAATNAPPVSASSSATDVSTDAHPSAVADATSSPAARPVVPEMTQAQAAALSEIRARMRALAVPPSHGEASASTAHEAPITGRAAEQPGGRAPSDRAGSPAHIASDGSERSMPALDRAAAPTAGRSTADARGEGKTSSPATARGGVDQPAAAMTAAARENAAEGQGDTATVRLSIPGMTGRREVFAALSRHLATQGGLASTTEEELWGDASPRAGSQRATAMAASAGTASARTVATGRTASSTSAAPRSGPVSASPIASSSAGAASTGATGRVGGDDARSRDAAGGTETRAMETLRGAAPVRLREGAERAEQGSAAAKAETPRPAPARPAETVIVIHRTVPAASRMPRGVASRSTVRGRHLRPLR